MARCLGEPCACGHRVAQELPQTPTPAQRHWQWYGRPLGLCILLCLDTLVALVVLAPLLDGFRWPFFFIFILNAAILAGATRKTLARDPVDQHVAAKLAGKQCTTTATAGGSDTEARYFCRSCDSEVCRGSKHCWDCGICIAHFDHHCPWIDMCIGKENYKPFFAMISSLLTMLSLLVGSSGTALGLAAFGDGPELYGASEEIWIPLVAVTLVLNAPVFVFAAGLVSFHTFLCIRHTTTLEFLKGRAAEREAKRQAWESKQGKPSAGGGGGSTFPAKDSGNNAGLQGVMADHANQQPMSCTFVASAKKLAASWMIVPSNLGQVREEQAVLSASPGACRG